MADDTQDPTPPRPETTDTTNQFNPQGPSAERKKPKYEATSQVGKLWDAFGNPEDSANTLAGVNSRHNDTKDMTVPEVLKSMSFHNVKSFYRAPCARDSLLTGMGFGFAAGGLRTIVGGTRSLPAAANWAVGGFVAVSVVTHELCQRRRRKELDGMKQVVVMMKDVKEKKQREKQEALQEAARRAEEDKKSWTNLSNYKFW